MKWDWRPRGEYVEDELIEAPHKFIEALAALELLLPDKVRPIERTYVGDLMSKKEGVLLVLEIMGHDGDTAEEWEVNVMIFDHLRDSNDVLEIAVWLGNFDEGEGNEYPVSMGIGWKSSYFTTQIATAAERIENIINQSIDHRLPWSGKNLFGTGTGAGVGGGLIGQSVNINVSGGGNGGGANVSATLNAIRERMRRDGTMGSW